MSSLVSDFDSHLNLEFPELRSGRSLLALSGGLDSMVLCKLLLEQGIDFSVAHCNFQLRGTESDGDQEFVQRTANAWGLDAHIKRFDALGYARNKKLALQLAARELRYAWFEELLDRTGSDFLLTAHHADDNLETFLINLSRGSGLKGLSGIPKKINHIRRPLLPFSRESLQLYAESWWPTAPTPPRWRRRSAARPGMQCSTSPGS